MYIVLYWVHRTLLEKNIKIPLSATYDSGSSEIFVIYNVGLESSVTINGILYFLTL